MRALFPFLIAFPVLVFARPVWACDHDDDDDSDDVAEVEPPEAPEPPDAPAHWVAEVFDAPLDIDIRWDIDVRWNDRDDNAAATDLVRDQIEDLQRQLEDATRDLHVLQRR
jgi:hypothetical protein